MIQRFRAFLELSFREIAPTKESEDYKTELLGILMDRSDEMTKNGVTDQEEIYKTCIEQLGDFKANFVNFKSTPDVKKVVKKGLIGVGIGLAYMLVIVTVFLAISFTVAPWSKTWLIPVCGALIGVLALMVYSSVIASRRKHYLATRFMVAVIMTLSILITYLCFSVLTPNAWSVSWLLFLFLPILIPGADLICCIAMESKTTLISLIVFIITAATMVYVILGITEFIAWHPFWLIPVVAFVIDVIIAIVGIKFKFFNKK